MKTNNFKKRILVVMVTALLCCGSAKAQITPSVYAGFGNYTNLGGMVGVGTEIQYKFVSVNAAIGYDGCNQIFFRKGYYAGKERVGDNPFIGFDVGVKCYFYKGLFGGVNYGQQWKQHFPACWRILVEFVRYGLPELCLELHH